MRRILPHCVLWSSSLRVMLQLLCCCRAKTPWPKQPRKGGVDSGWQFQVVAHHGSKAAVDKLECACPTVREWGRLGFWVFGPISPCLSVQHHSYGTAPPAAGIFSPQIIHHILDDPLQICRKGHLSGTSGFFTLTGNTSHQKLREVEIPRIQNGHQEMRNPYKKLG